MGYTQYHCFKEDVNKFDEGLLNQVEAVIEYFSDILKDDCICSNKEIRFNGEGENGYETFVLKPCKDLFECTKTGRRAYDLPVCIVLLLIKRAYQNKFIIKSDGYLQEDMDKNWIRAKYHIMVKFNIEIDLFEYLS